MRKMIVQKIFITHASRTPMGAFQGQLKFLKAPHLAAVVTKSLIEKSKIKSISSLYMGCVLSAGLGQSPARQVIRYAGLDDETHAATVNKVCGSGLQSIMFACDQIRLDPSQVCIAGGMESMTNAPYLLDRARAGLRLGHGNIIDHIFYDGLEDPYNQNKLMGCFADETAKKYQISREEQDNFTIDSFAKAKTAMDKGFFKNEICSLKLPDGSIIDQDEPPLKGNMEKIPKLKPAFSAEGTVTAANSSSIADGSAAVILASEESAKQNKLTPLARVCGYVTHSQAPEWFTTAPVGAIKKLCNQLNWSLDEVDLFEINEAFAVVTLVTAKELGIPMEKVNIHGGACALGHPIGASGARVLVTLLHALKQQNLKKGIASLCIGGGESVAIGIEII